MGHAALVDMAVKRNAGVRLAPELMAEIDAWAREREAAEPGLKLSRNDATAMLINRGLASYRTEQKPKTTGDRKKKRGKP